jgi:outer membrane protein assembly factor BamB
MDDDAKPEVVAVTPGFGIFVLNGEDGSVLWKKKGVKAILGEDIYPPVVSISDIDNDGRAEIVEAYLGQIFALNGDNGSLLWSHELCDDLIYNFFIGDINGDAKVEIVIGEGLRKNGCSSMNVINAEDTSLLWSIPKGSVSSSPYIYDIDDDGSLEVIYGSRDNKIYALNAEDGTLVWMYDYDIPESDWDFTSSSFFYFIRDIDKNGRLGVVVVAHTGNKYKYYALNGVDGSVLWSGEYECNLSFWWIAPPIADIDNDGLFEIINRRVWKMEKNRSEVYAINVNDGSLRWVYEITEEAFPPCVGDLDGDKELEVLFFSSEKKLYAINGKDGSLLWSYKIDNPQYNPVYFTCPVIVDINNDALPEVIFGADKLYILNGKNGSLIWSYKTQAYVDKPYIFDLNKDGLPDILFGTSDGKIYAITPDL